MLNINNCLSFNILYNKYILKGGQKVNFLVEDICRCIGQTVTIFTASGGASGKGFTGVLISVTNCAIKLLVSVGAAPACPLGSRCRSCNRCRYKNNCTPLGAIAIIPTNAIVAFVHNAI